KARAWKVRTVGRIRPSLRFEADGVGLPVEPASLSRNRAIEIVSGIDLQPRLIRQELENPSRFWRLEPCRKASFARIIKAEVMVVASTVTKLRISAADPGTDCRGLAEIEGRI